MLWSALMAEVTLIEGAADGEIARWLEARLEEALAAATGEIAVTLPGGSTPFPILEALIELPLDFARIAVWPGDDRLVPEDHPASNVGRIRKLLEPRGARIVPLTPDAEPPHFALAWLGMGEDGHIASLFPNTDPRADDPQRVRRIMPDPLPPEAPFERITLTIPALLASDRLLFVIRGPGKRAVFESAASGPFGEGDAALPVGRLLAAARQPVTCFT